MTVDPFIEAEKQGGHSVKRACELLQVSRAAFYARRTDAPGPRAVRDAELTEKITEVHAVSRGSYGAPRIHAALQREGERCGRRRVARLMRQRGLQGQHRRRRQRTTIPDPRAAVRPDLVLRDFQPNPAKRDVRWCGDVTYIPTEEGWLYLATVIDIASRRVVGWATADHLRTELVAEALASSLPQPPTRGPGDLSLGPRMPVHQPRFCHSRKRVGHQPVGRPHRPVLGQRPRRVVLRNHRARVARRPVLAQPGGSPLRNLRVDRGLVQHT